MITPLGSVFDAANQQRQSYDCSYMTKTVQQCAKLTADVYVSIVTYIKAHHGHFCSSVCDTRARTL
jgi:hypothetical protein